MTDAPVWKSWPQTMISSPRRSSFWPTLPPHLVLDEQPSPNQVANTRIGDRVGFEFRLADDSCIGHLVGTGLFVQKPDAAAKVGQKLDRRGDEIMVCGQLFHTGASVILWTDHRRLRRLSHRSAISRALINPPTPPPPGSEGITLSQSLRPAPIGPHHASRPSRSAARGWPLELLQQKVDQFVIHYDVCGTSAQCFFILHDVRDLSVHFMLDVDGTIYQTLDLKERAWHATIANSRSVGIEIANIGAYPVNSKDNPLDSGIPTTPPASAASPCRSTSKKEISLPICRPADSPGGG